MATRSWLGGSGSWFTAADWSGNAVPQPDDAVIIATGTVNAEATTALAGDMFDAEAVSLGGATAVATLAAISSAFGERFSVTSNGLALEAAFVAVGAVGYSGQITANASGGTFALSATQANGSQAGDFELLDGGIITVLGGDDLVTTGRISNHGTILVGSGGTLTDDGLIAQSDAVTHLESGGTLLGTGSIAIGLYSSLYLDAGSSVGALGIGFAAAGGRLLLGSPTLYSGSITGFAVGDLIDLTATTADYASYSAGTGVLTVRSGGALGSVVATLNLAGLSTAVLTVASDGTGGVTVALPATGLRTDYTITGDSVAIHGNLAAAMTTKAGAAITGAGVKIGIISDSFNSNGGANAEAAEGFLPETVSGTSAVTVLGDQGGSDEGRAMAELVHQVAPGAALYFDTDGPTEDSFAAAVTALKAAGCSVIVDDISIYSEPFFQVAGPVDTAIEAAIAGGTSYFSAAGNYASAFYEASFAGTSTVLHGASTPVSAQTFGNGTPYQTITVPGGTSTTVELQWDAAWPATGQGVADSLVLNVYTLAGALVASSTQISGSPDYSGEPAVSLTLTPGATTQYQVAIYQPAGTPAVSLFKYVLFGSSSSAQPGGTIDDPQAGSGSGVGSGTVTGHADVPDVNTVAAVSFADTPAFGDSGSFPDYFSSTGTAIDFTAADGSAAAVSKFAPFYGTSAAAPNAAAVAALMLQANPSLTPAQVSALLKQSAVDLGLPAAEQGAGLIQADAAVALAEAACYVAGTRILTAHGARAVETLKVGDPVVALRRGGLARIAWLGHRRIDCRRHPHPERVWPIEIAADALAPGVPHAALRVSPDHALFLDGQLVAARLLANGATIRQVRVDVVEYWHVELDRHELLLAEGAAAESYLDTGNRSSFLGGGPALALHPEAGPAIWQVLGCAPMLPGGERLAGLRRRLLARAGALGHATTAEPDLHLLADGRRVSPEPGARYRFAVPAGTRRLRLRSRSAVPAELRAAGTDPRRLGVAVAELACDGAPLPMGGDGWHADEGGWRWTDGDAALPCPGGGVLTLKLALGACYWAETPAWRANRAGA